MRDFVAVAHALAHDDGSKAVLYRVHCSGADAAAGRTAGQDQGVDSLRLEHGGQ
ncbi:hypothetical protein D3C85_1906060 [compost metagenome]